MNLRQRIRTAGVGNDSQANELGRILINACVKANLTLMEFVERVIGQKEHDNRKFAEAATTGEERFNLVMRNLSVDLAAAVTEIGTADLENFDAIPVKHRRSLFEGDGGNNFAKFEEFVNNKVAEIRAAITLAPVKQAVDYMCDDCDVALMSRVDASASIVTVSIPKSVSTSVIPVAAGGAGAVADVPAAVVPTKTPAEILHEQLLVQSSFYKALQIAKNGLVVASLSDKEKLLLNLLVKLQQQIAFICCLKADAKFASTAKEAYITAIAQLAGVILGETEPCGTVPMALKPYLLGVYNGTLQILEVEHYVDKLDMVVEKTPLDVRVVKAADWVVGRGDRYAAKKARAQQLTSDGIKCLADSAVGISYEEGKLDLDVVKASEYGWGWGMGSRMAQIARGFNNVFSNLGDVFIPRSAREASEASEAVPSADKELLEALNVVLMEGNSVCKSSSSTVFLVRTEASDNLDFGRVWGGKST